MPQSIETSFETAAGNLRQVVQYEFSSFSQTEPANSVLLSLYNIWDLLRSDNEMPRAEAFESNKLNILGNNDHISLLDVSDPNPWNIRNVTPTRLFRNSTDLIINDAFVRDLPVSMHARATMRECLKAQQAETPLYHELFMNFSGETQHFMQLTLPLSNAGGVVSHLLIGARDTV